MLIVNNIEVIYSQVILVLRGISLEIPEGKIVCVLGANGAGKSTTLKAISGLLKREEGEISRGSINLNGDRLNDLPPEDIVRMGIVQVLEGGRLFEHLTVEENLLVGGLIHGKNKSSLREDLDQVYHYFPQLEVLKKQTSGYLSGGEKQMLVIGRGLMAHPKFLMLDEPSLGLAPLLVEEIFSIICQINQEENTSILLVEQNARMALEVASYAYVLENGRVVLDGPPDQIKDNQDIREFYLGLTQLGERKSYRDVKHYKRRKRWLG
jgi:branched-chain amino acid transport system ATP-binding protein